MAGEIDARCSDAERETTVARLRAAAGEGRLQLDELAERVEGAYGAVTRTDLARLVSDLPELHGTPEPPAQTPPESAAPARRRLFAVMGGDSISGAMRLEPGLRIVNVMGSTDLDLTQARLQDGEVVIRIFSLMGGSTIRVPHGVHVEHSGFAFMGGDEVDPELPDEAASPGAPVVRIRAVSIMGGNEVKRGPRSPGPRRLHRGATPPS